MLRPSIPLPAAPDARLHLPKLAKKAKMKRLLTLSRWCALSVALVACGCSGGGSTGGPATGSGDSPAATVANEAPAVVGDMPAGAVFPTVETVKSGEYKPLSRPLFIYVNKASLQKPAVVEYVRYYVSDEGQALVPEVGYVSLSATQTAETRQRFDQALQSAGVTAATGAVEGEVRINGSSTVAPISSAVSEEVHNVQPKVRAGVGTAGTSGGFKDFVRGDIDICDASRPIKSSEVEACAAAGIEYVELTVAIDGLTVVVNQQNDWISGITVAQLNQIWEPDSKVTKWSDVDPQWPAEPIKLFGAGTDSGTFDYFTEVICGETGKSRNDYQASENDNILVTGVAGEKYALGYFGFAYYIENQDKLKALAIAP
jgi:phosphate binding protein